MWALYSLLSTIFLGTAFEAYRDELARMLKRMRPQVKGLSPSGGSHPHERAPRRGCPC